MAWCGRSLRVGGQALIVLASFELISGLIPGVDVTSQAAATATVELAAGGFAALVPVGRPSRACCMLLTVFLFVTLGVAGATNAIPTGSSSVLVILLYVWGGFWQRPNTPIKLAPLAALCCYSPWLFDPASKATNGAGVLIVVPAAVLVGEALAHQGDRMIATEIARRAAVDALAAAAVTDELTGVGNYRRARHMIGELQPGDALAILDLDRFKQVNDRYGHSEGDRLLHRLGEFLLHSTRGAGNVARIGGEEFIVILPGAGDRSEIAIERLQQEWRDLNPLTTFSVGLCVSEPGVDGAATFVTADAALYRAKENGRDRLEMAGR